MKYLKRFNESKSEIDKLIDPVRSEIEDILIEFKSGYDLRFQYFAFFRSFQLEIIPKGYPLTHSDIEPILIDSDILGDLMAVCKFIKSELSFNYMNSYYYESKDIRYNYPLDDVFKSSGKLVTVIQMYFKRTDNSNEKLSKYIKYFKESKDDIIFVRTNKFDNTGTVNKLPYKGIQCFAINQNDLVKYKLELELWGGSESDVVVVDSTGLTPYALDYNKVHSWVMGESDILPDLLPFNSDIHTMNFTKMDSKSMLEWISDLGLGKSCYQVILVDNLNESFDVHSFQQHHMSSRYGSDVMSECDSLMLDIKDLSYDLQDLGFDITLYYSYSTVNLQASTPRIELNIFGSDSLFRDNNDIFQETIDTIKKMISSYGFSYGASFGSTGFAGTTDFKKYVLIIEK
jgi:hypothetical protein